MKIKLGKLLVILETVVGAAPTIVQAIKPIVAAARRDVGKPVDASSTSGGDGGKAATPT